MQYKILFHRHFNCMESLELVSASRFILAVELSVYERGLSWTWEKIVHVNSLMDCPLAWDNLSPTRVQ